MEVLQNLFQTEMFQRLGWTLLHFTWQATAIALILAIILKLLHKSSANSRYLIACMALALIVLMSAVTIRIVNVSPDSIPPTTQATVEWPKVSVDVQPQPQTIVAIPQIESPPPQATSAPSIPLKEKLIETVEPALPYIVVGWLVGVFGLSLWHLGGWTQLQRLRKQMVKQVTPALITKCQQLSKSLGIQKTIDLMESALVQVPTVVGHLKPIILLPASALTGLSPQQIEAILAHELAHIKRHDYLVNMLQTIVEILGFYHPAVWWISNKIRTERENSCDDIAVSLCTDRVCYAKALTTMEEIRSRQPTLAIAASGGNLLNRIRRLLGKDSPSEAKQSWLPSVMVILLISSLLIPVCLAISSRSERERESNPKNITDQTKINFKKTLPNGVTVELVGVCEHPNAGKQWWRADGSLLNKRPYENGGLSIAPVPGRNALEAAFKTEGSDNEISFRCQIEGMGANSSFVDGSVFGIAFDQTKEKNEADIRVGIATGPWETVATQESDFDGVYVSQEITWHGPAEKKGNAVLHTVHTMIDKNTRIVAIDQDGKEHTGGSNSGTRKGVMSVQTTFKLPLSKIKKFQFQTRPYQWVEFKNVSLKPNFKTDVPVEQVNETANNITSQIIPSFPWHDDFEADDFDMWDSVEDKPQIVDSDSHSGLYSAELEGGYEQLHKQGAIRSDSIVRLFPETPKQVTVEAWIKVTQWSEAWADVHFSFLKDPENLFDGIGRFWLWSQTEGYYFDQTENEKRFAHHLPMNQWNHLKIGYDVTNGGTISYYENDVLQLTIANAGTDINGFFIGAGGCCGPVKFLVDDVSCNIETVSFSHSKKKPQRTEEQAVENKGVRS